MDTYKFSWYALVGSQTLNVNGTEEVEAASPIEALQLRRSDIIQKLSTLNARWFCTGVQFYFAVTTDVDCLEAMKFLDTLNAEGALLPVPRTAPDAVITTRGEDGILRAVPAYKK